MVAIAKPSLRNAKGRPLVLFRRLLLTQSQTLPVLLQNTGTIPATALVETTSGHQDFKVSSVDGPEVEEGGETPGTADLASQPESTRQPSSGRKSPTQALMTPPPPLLVRLGIGEAKEFLVTFQPHATKKCRGELCLRIEHNQFENLPVQLVGEGYEDEVCIENIRGQIEEPLTGQPASDETQELPDDVEGIIMCKYCHNCRQGAA